MEIRQKISPFLWFDADAEAAATFYVSVFPNSRITAISRYGAAGPGPEGTVMTVGFELAGQSFHALNGGPLFAFSNAVSFFIDCEHQDEIDRLWAVLGEGGEALDCGWLKDRFGLSWQVSTALLPKMLADPDPARRGRVMQAMLNMRKIDLGALKAAYQG